jgi:hypothetical protein
MLQGQCSGGVGGKGMSWIRGVQGVQLAGRSCTLVYRNGRRAEPLCIIRDWK